MAFFLSKPGMEAKQALKYSREGLLWPISWETNNVSKKRYRLALVMRPF